MTLLRSAVFNAWFFGLTAVLGIWGLGIRWFAPRRALGMAQLWGRLVLAGLRRICAVQVVVTGREHLPASGPALIASQHQSAFDTLIWLELVSNVSYVYKIELQRVPLFGPLLVLAGQIGVDRSAGLSALRSLLRGAERAAAEGRQIVIFPEGTRTAPGESVLLQPGVAAISARTGLPVIPVATDSGLRVEVTATGDDTTLAGIQKLVADAQASGSRAQRLADIAAGWLFWFALAAAAVTAVVWSVVGSPDDAVVRAITVLVIACPHALGLAIPLVIAISTERAAKAGVLIKDRLALERMRTIDVVLFDKTGTLTEGAHAVTGAVPVPGTSKGELLALAAAAEADSEHPVARAIVTAAAQDPEAQRLGLRGTDLRSATGRGVRATIDGRTVLVGGPALLREVGADEPPALAAATAAWRDRGAAVLHVVDGNTVLGAVSLEDAVRPESRQGICQDLVSSRGEELMHRLPALLGCVPGIPVDLDEAIEILLLERGHADDDGGRAHALLMACREGEHMWASATSSDHVHDIKPQVVK